MRAGSVCSAAVLTLALAAMASPASGDVTVGAIGPDGNMSRIGPVRGDYLDLARSTVAEVRRAEGRKPNADLPVMGRGGVVGRMLTYRIRESRRRTCRRTYAFPRRRARLQDFSSTCMATRTPRGTRVGTSAREAEAREKVPAAASPSLGHDCAFADVGVAVRGSGSIWLVLWMDSQDPRAGKTAKVRSIDLLGPDAVTWSAACG